MKRIHYYIQLILCALLCASCIEEYNELPTGQAEQMVVIDGQIVSDRTCTFSLRWSSPLSIDDRDAFPLISRASIAVAGTDGQHFPGYELPDDPGHYAVSVGTLSPDAEYYVQFQVPDAGVFRSQPMRPLDTPDIASLTFEQPRQDRMIDFMVTTADVQGPACFLWEYDETWEIYTPYIAYWYYWYRELEGSDSMSPLYEGEYRPIDPSELTNHGWCTFTGRESVIATNADYGQGAVRNLCLYQRHPDDNRFQTRYLSRVRQMAITQQEYEYRHLLATQSTEMGGLFTPMPSELPSNVTTLEGDARALGFIGVRGRVCEAELYVPHQDVDHHNTYRVETVPDSLTQDPVLLVRLGYRCIDYNPLSGTSQWSNRWVVDCTDRFWSASLQRPAYWRDEVSPYIESTDR